MKIQIAAVLSTDCYLLSPAKGINSRWAFPKQHTLFSLRNETDLLLSKDTSLLSLLSEKQHNTDITYLAEVTPDTLDLIKGLLLYGLADELYLYILPEHTGKRHPPFDAYQAGRMVSRSGTSASYHQPYISEERMKCKSALHGVRLSYVYMDITIGFSKYFSLFYY